MTKFKYKLVYDFETTVTGDINQEKTEVWADATVELDAPDEYSSVTVGASIEAFINKLFSYDDNALGYFHNEKFDGSFVIDYLLKHGYTYAVVDKDKDLMDDCFTSLISSKGLWYTIKIRHNGNLYEIRDSYKLLPFSVKQIGKSFGTKHQKTEIEYVGDRKPNGVITEQEREYIANDVLVIKEALNILEQQGKDKMTIGSCCMSEYKEITGWTNFNKLFPNLYGNNYRLADGYGAESAGDYIRKSYKGGWCYLNPTYEGKHLVNIKGTTADVNSLYPSSMLSPHKYPFGLPRFGHGKIPDYIANSDDIYYFIRIKTRFYIKENHLPTIQLKNNIFYYGREWLTTSDYVDEEGNTFTCLEDDIHGGYIEMIPEMTLTMTDWELMQEHYNLKDTEFLDYCWFYAKEGFFDEYINKYAEIKMNAKDPAIRQLAKLHLNNLYGRFATSTDASYKIPYLKDGVVHFEDKADVNIKKGAYIPIGSAITSYSRAFTIRAAQKNIDKYGYDAFCYSDTDSIHVLLEPDQIVGAPEHPTKFSHWKYEACWDEAIFVRAKTYIEHVTHDNREPIEPYYNVKCAGMPDRAKDNFIAKLTREPMTDDDDPEEYGASIGVKHLNPDEIAFHKLPKFTLDDFKIGLRVPGSLKPKRIIGGIVLLNGMYEMRPNIINRNKDNKIKKNGFIL